MRVPAFLLLLAIAGPAAAQIMPGQVYDAGREAEYANQQMMARQREVAAQNQMMALDAQVRTDQAVRQIEAGRVRPILPGAAAGASAPPGQASIPDDRLAASQQRVRDAAANRR